MLRTFLFDLDGTLVDSIPLILASIRHTLETHLGHVPPDDVCLRGVGTPLRTQFGTFFDDPATVEAMFHTYKAHNDVHHDGLIRAFPGVREALLALRARGGRLGVVTSKMGEAARRGLSVCGLADLFETVVALEDATHHKPHPEPVRIALERLGATAEGAVYVGDAPFDLQAGRAAGTQTAAALWGPFPRDLLAAYAPDRWLERPEEIAGLG